MLLNLFCAFNPFYNPYFNGLAGPCFSAPAGRGFSGPAGRGFTSLLGFALAALLAGVLIQVADYFGWVSYGDGAGWDVLNHYRSCTHYGVVTNGDPGADDYPATKPNIVTDSDGFAAF